MKDREERQTHRARPSVWLDVRTESCPIFPKSCPKSKHSSLESSIFQNSPKSCQTLGLLLYEKLSPRPFKNSQIWSHCWLGKKRQTDWGESDHKKTFQPDHSKIEQFIKRKKRLPIGGGGQLEAEKLTEYYFFLKMGHSRPLFLYFRLFNTQLTVNKCSIYI